MTHSGWFRVPEFPGMERFWDGDKWSHMWRPIPSPEALQEYAAILTNEHLERPTQVIICNTCGMPRAINERDVCDNCAYQMAMLDASSRPMSRRTKLSIAGLVSLAVVIVAVASYIALDSAASSPTNAFGGDPASTEVMPIIETVFTPNPSPSATSTVGNDARSFGFGSSDVSCGQVDPVCPSGLENKDPILVQLLILDTPAMMQLGPQSSVRNVVDAACNDLHEHPWADVGRSYSYLKARFRWKAGFPTVHEILEQASHVALCSK